MRPPNMRVQRTRSASLRSPLTRGPLGARMGLAALAFWCVAIQSLGGVMGPTLVRRVQITEAGIWFDSRHITLPCTAADLEAALGTPSAVIPAHGDQYSKTVLEWEAQGMYAYMDPRSEEIHSIGLSLSETRPERHFKTSFSGQILIDDVVLTPCSTITAREEAGFQQDKEWWTRTVGDYYLLWIADLVDDAPQEFEIDLH